jgi:hypothetical protein
LPWLFVVFCASIWTLWLIFQPLWGMPQEFWWGLLLVVIVIFITLILPIHEHGRSFHLMMSSSVSFLNGL